MLGLVILLVDGTRAVGCDEVIVVEFDKEDWYQREAATLAFSFSQSKHVTSSRLLYEKVLP